MSALQIFAFPLRLTHFACTVISYCHSKWILSASKDQSWRKRYRQAIDGNHQTGAHVRLGDYVLPDSGSASQVFHPPQPNTIYTSHFSKLTLRQSSVLVCRLSVLLITTRFSVAALLPLVIAVPALSAYVQARDGSWGGVDYNNKDGQKDDGKKGYNNKDYGEDNGRGDCNWGAGVREQKRLQGVEPLRSQGSRKDHLRDRYPYFLLFDRVIDGFFPEWKSFYEKDDKWNSCQAYQHDEKDDNFVCELFVEIIDINTWENDCDYSKDDKDRKDPRRMTRSTTTLRAGTPTMDGKSDASSCGW
ncbi:hypothetical protein IW261DRAFT_1425998 [Armillaria novae-zelandiae]|uniref:F-box domain-containing protein n=1 Tax=Armillaria novae-zelandiae TaxID=153914 RepID=A0AA39NNK3_9AGAR|nr:hypothetical protein IW261DRAFT_1425998 [Armillaria novae-zelandiae]